MIIDLQQLERSFEGRRVLGPIDLTVPAGQVLTLLGRNGSGKSTLLKILSTLLVASKGKALIDGADVARESDRVRKAIGVLFQSPALDPILTARENLTHHGHLLGLGGSELRRRVDAKLAEVELADRAGDRVGTFSGGMKRRLEIAKATLAEPKLLLLDEPDAGLDLPGRSSLMGFLRAFASRGGTCVVATHAIELAEQSDRVVMIHQGLIVADDSPRGLRDRAGASVIRVETGALGASLEALKSVPDLVAGQVRVIDDVIFLDALDPPRALTQVAQALQDHAKAITLQRPGLDQAFLRIVGAKLDERAS